MNQLRIRTAAAGRRRGRARLVNERARQAWAAAGYHRQDRWRRWVKPFEPVRDTGRGRADGPVN
ncbi:hypothetical protein [Streptomyces sp. NPDC058701]|uniref:hypothetical protein n=1 Tax=Streptomyces sp. NPDC058701 TaxID=3346608 RepID=UPI003667A688